jgi:gluconokinase
MPKPIPGLRSAYDEVGGLVYFGRLLDKVRLHAAGKLPADYQPNLGTGFDGRFCTFAQVEYPTIVTRVAQGGTDAEILAWCLDHGRKPSAEEMEIWNDFMRKRGWRDVASERLHLRLEEGGIGHRREIATFFDLIEIDEGRPPRCPLY